MSYNINMNEMRIILKTMKKIFIYMYFMTRTNECIQTLYT